MIKPLEPGGGPETVLGRASVLLMCCHCLGQVGQVGVSRSDREGERKRNTEIMRMGPPYPKTLIDEQGAVGTYTLSPYANRTKCSVAPIL